MYLNEPSDKVPKHRILRCPFLYRRGICLKGNQWIFHIVIPQAFRRPKCLALTPTCSMVLYVRPQRQNSNIQVPPFYPMAPWSTNPRLKLQSISQHTHLGEKNSHPLSSSFDILAWHEPDRSFSSYGTSNAADTRSNNRHVIMCVRSQTEDFVAILTLFIST